MVTKAKGLIDCRRRLAAGSIYGGDLLVWSVEAKKKRRAFPTRKADAFLVSLIISKQSFDSRCIPERQDSFHEYRPRFPPENSTADPCSGRRTAVRYTGFFCWLHDSFNFAPFRFSQDIVYWAKVSYTVRTGKYICHFFRMMQEKFAAEANYRYCCKEGVQCDG